MAHSLQLKVPENAEKILLHACCAPCSSAIVEALLNAGVEPVVFYFNPNIFPKEEYDKRKSELTRFCEKLNLRIVDSDYLHGDWIQKIKGMENEPERGIRCLSCFKMRLLETAKTAFSLGIKVFATTLASSRYKDLKQIEAAGLFAESKVEGTKFWSRNWRANGLWGRRNELLKEYNFYNQTYCGCEFSMRDKNLKKFPNKNIVEP